jgi:cyclophilin family peptidyl-prolyl cis-trans isomerase
MVIDTAKTYSAVLTTDKGAITIELLTEYAPVTVNNFVFLAREGYYNGTTFHRVIKGFMIQGGDPTGTGTGSPGYTFADEPVRRDYTRGIVAMANAGPNTNGSQFFILHADYPLPKQYTIFGRVVSGMEVVDAIAEAPVVQGSERVPSKPVTPVVVQTIEVREQ